METKKSTITITKEELFRALASLSDPIPIDKLIYTIRIIEKLKIAMTSAEVNGTISHEAFLKELRLDPL